MTNDTNTIIDSTKGAGQCLRFQSHWGCSTSNSYNVHVMLHISRQKNVNQKTEFEEVKTIE
jgi:hypothetical protein